MRYVAGSGTYISTEEAETGAGVFRMSYDRPCTRVLVSVATATVGAILYRDRLLPMASRTNGCTVIGIAGDLDI